MKARPEPRDRIFVALDTPDAGRARALAVRLAGHVGGFKIGLELFTAHGRDIVSAIRELGEVFLDLKFHDIPNTAAGAAAAAARLGVSYYTLHTTGGTDMLRRAVEASDEAAAAAGQRPPVALGVTVLTSHDDRSLDAIGMRGPCETAVVRLAALAREAGLGGCVCSAAEVAILRREFPEATLVVPGIRPVGATVTGDDQARTAAPGRVVELGADRLVVGRPITRADDPVAAAQAIARDIERARRQA